MPLPTLVVAQPSPRCAKSTLTGPITAAEWLTGASTCKSVSIKRQGVRALWIVAVKTLLEVQWPGRIENTASVLQQTSIYCTAAAKVNLKEAT